jgi:hypothetical protein
MLYVPSKLAERKGEVTFIVREPLLDENSRPGAPISQGGAAIGTALRVGNYSITPREVRYWVGMHVSYEPGQPIILTSLWIGLAGMIITTFGRMVRRSQ